MAFVFSTRSKNNLKGVHPDLVWVIARALVLSKYDFIVTEGLRTLERQKKLKAEGKSKTLNSKHLKQADGYGHAIDVAALVPTTVKSLGNKPATTKSTVSWETKYYKDIADAVDQAAKELGVKITWGGSWGWDCPHFQLDSAASPPKSSKLTTQYETASVA